MGKDGGTRFWCEECSQIRPFTVSNDLLYQRHNGLYETEGIPFRRRNKHCTQCGFEITTVEINEYYFNNLLNLQKKVRNLKDSIDEEVAEIEFIKKQSHRRNQARIDALLKKLGLTND